MDDNILNEDAYEQLKSSCDAVKLEAIDIDITSDVENYVDSLEKEDDGSERQRLLEEHVQTIIKPELLNWKRKYAGNDGVLQRIHTKLRELKNFERDVKVNIDDLNEKIKQEKVEKKLVLEEIDDEETKTVGKEKIDLSYEWKKSFIFIFFSILIALGTYTYFLDNQISLKWSVKNTDEKATAIESMIRDQDLGYITYIAKTQTECFSEYRNEDTDRVDIERLLPDLEYYDLSCIDPVSLTDAPRPSFRYALFQDHKLLILAVSALLLILFGKVIAIFYEKMKYPNWLFYTFGISTGVVLLGMVFVSGSLTQLQIDKSQYENRIASLEKKQLQIKKDFEEFNPDEFDEEGEDILNKLPEVIKIDKDIQELETQLPIVDTKISNYNFWVSLFTMLTELTMGAIAWMTYSDYIRKKQEKNSGGEALIDKLKEKIINIDETIGTLKKMIAKNNNDKSKAEQLNADISTLVGLVQTNHQIVKIADSTENKIIADAKSILKSAEKRWHKG